MRTTWMLPVLAGLGLTGFVVWLAVSSSRVANSQERAQALQQREAVPRGLLEPERWADFTHVFEWQPESARKD